MIRSVFILPAMSRTGIYKADKKTQLSSNQRPLKNNDKRHFRVEASSCLDIPAGFNLSESGLSEDILKSLCRWFDSAPGHQEFSKHEMWSIESLV